jgi:outer membrane protein
MYVQAMRIRRSIDGVRARLPASGFWRRFIFRSCVTIALLATPFLCAVASAEEPASDGWNGYLGLGTWWRPNYVGGTRDHVFLTPIADLDYKDIVYVYFDRAGARFWASDDKKMALGVAGEPRFGFRASDGSRLRGMETRNDAIEGGPTFEWELPGVSVSVAYFRDLADTSDGEAWHFSLFRQLIDRKPWDVSVYADFEHISNRVVQYYFGVRPDEATAARPAYWPGSTMNKALGLNGAYRLSKNTALLFGGEIDFLGAAAAASPIVLEPVSLSAHLGYGIAF